jgi:hypothetical protein
LKVTPFPEPLPSACRWEEKEKREEASGLCPRGNLHHEPISRNTSEILSQYNMTDNFKTIGKSYIFGELRLRFYALTTWIVALSSPRYALTACSSIRKLHVSHSRVTRQNGTVRTTTIRTLQSLIHLGPRRGNTWVYMTHDPGSAISFACRAHSIAISLGLSQGTQVGSGVETVGKHHTGRRNPVLVRQKSITVWNLE